MNLRKCILSLLMLLPVLLYSQPQSGIKFGINESFVKDDVNFKYSPRIGFDIG